VISLNPSGDRQDTSSQNFSPIKSTHDSRINFRINLTKYLWGSKIFQDKHLAQLQIQKKAWRRSVTLNYRTTLGSQNSLNEGGEKVFGSIDLAFKSARIADFCGKRADSRSLKTQRIVDPLCILKRIPDCGCLDDRILGPKRKLDHRSFSTFGWLCE